MPFLSSCCICTCITSIFIIIALSIGIFLLFFASDTRESRLIEYNQAIEEWNSGQQPQSHLKPTIGLSLLKSLPTSSEGDVLRTVTLFLDDSEIEVLGGEKDTVSSYDVKRYTLSNTYIFQDFEPTDRIYFASPIEDLNQGGKRSKKSYVPLGPIEMYESVDMRSYIEAEDHCVSNFFGGFDHDTETCYIRKRLTDICIVVDFDTGRIHPMSGKSFGCFEKWSPTYYTPVVEQTRRVAAISSAKKIQNSRLYGSGSQEKLWIPIGETSISITVRDYRDPFLKALETTDFTLDFGWSIRKKRFVGGLFLILGSGPLIVFAGSVAFICTLFMCLRRLCRKRKSD